MIRLKRYLGFALLRLCGWDVVGAPIVERRFVLIAAPHTSNWDLLFMLAAAYALGLRLAWLGKHTLFTPPLGWLLQAVGGIPVDRRSSHNAVQAAARRFRGAPSLVLAVPPEGTRARALYWRTGFYHIARAARVPIALGFLDYRRRLAGIGGFVVPSGELQRDMAEIRRFYASVSAKYPREATIPCLREENCGSDTPSPQGFRYGARDAAGS